MITLPKYIQPIFVFVLTLIVASLFSTIAVDPHHDGIMLKPALDVANGKTLFKDTFTQYGALTTLLQAMAIKIFGEYLITIKLLTAFFYAMISILLWVIWSRFIPKWLCTLSCIIWLFLAPYYELIFYPWSSVYALFFLLLSAYFFVVFLEKRSEIFLFLSGFSAALAFWSRQPVGIFLYAALVFIICSLFLLLKTNYKKMIRNVGILTLGYISVFAGFFIWLIVNDALRDWYLQSIKLAHEFPKLIGRQFSLKLLFTSLFPQNLSFIWSLFPIVCLLVLPKLLINVWSKQKFTAEETIVFALLFVSFASWLQYYPVTCIRHTYWAAAPMIGILSYFIWSTLSYKNTLYRSLAILVVLFLLFHADIGARFKYANAKLKQDYVQINTPSIFTGMQMTKYDVSFFGRISNTINRYLENHPKTNLITIGTDALYLTLSKNNENFHPVYVSWDIINATIYPDYPEKLNNYIKNNKPLIFGKDRIYDGYVPIGIFEGGFLLMAPGTRDDIFDIHDFKYSSEDKVGQQSITPDGVNDYVINIVFSGKTGVINGIYVEIFDNQGQLKGKWDTFLNTPYQLCAIYDQNKQVLLGKSADVNFPFKTGDKLTLLLTGDNARIPGTRVEVTMFFNNGNYAKKSIVISN